MTLEEIKDKLNSDAASALQWLMPEGRFIRQHFWCGDVFGSPPSKGSNGSFNFNLKKMVGKDFADSDRGYFGIYDVMVAHCRGDQIKAIALARDFLKLPPGRRPEPRQGHEHGSRGRRKQDDIEVLEVIVPTPETPPVFPPSHQRILAGHWPWRTADGVLHGYSYRIEFVVDGERKKIPLPLTWCRMRNSKTGDEWIGWHNAALPQPQPLMHAPDLLRKKRVLLVEGEKTCDAANRLIDTPNHPLSLRFDIATTWHGGTGRIEHVDWSIFSPDHDMTGWPDADAQNKRLYRPGTLSMEQIARKLAELPHPPVFKIADPLKHWSDVSATPLPKGWDLADPIPEPGTDAWITRTLDMAERYL
jgi:hypothetical protein